MYSTEGLVTVMDSTTWEHRELATKTASHQKKQAEDAMITTYSSLSKQG